MARANVNIWMISNPSKFGNINWGSILQQGITSIAPIVLGGSHGSGGAHCQLFAQIDAAAGQLNQIGQAIGSVPNSQILQAYQALRSAIYSLPVAGCNGEALAYLTQAKAVIDRTISDFQSGKNPLTGQSLTATGGGLTGALDQITGQPTAGASNQIIGGVPNSYLLIGAGALLLISMRR